MRTICMVGLEETEDVDGVRWWTWATRQGTGTKGTAAEALADALLHLMTLSEGELAVQRAKARDQDRSLIAYANQLDRLLLGGSARG